MVARWGPVCNLRELKMRITTGFNIKQFGGLLHVCTTPTVLLVWIT